MTTRASTLALISSPPAAELRRARWATRVQFLMLGACMGAWGAHVPSVKAHYGLGEGALSLVLLAGGVGAVLSLLVAGRMVAHLGVRRVARAAALLMMLALGGVLLMPHVGLVLVVMLLFGASTSLLDVAINTEGTELESAGGRAIMSNLHGMFSVGGMGGAALVSWMLYAGVSPRQQLIGMGLVIATVAVLASYAMLAVHSRPAGEAEKQHFVWPRGQLLVLGLLGFAGLTAEGVMYDWSVLYLKQDVGMPQAQAALGYAVFSGAMALSRLGGDALRARYRERSLLRTGALLAMGAMTVALLSAHGGVAIAGFALVGAGVALVAPILFTAATRVPGVSRAAAIAAVTSIGYSGFMIGPPLIGAIASATSLTLALGVVVLVTALLAVGARYVPEQQGV